MGIFSNPWVIGIGGGLVSGLLVTLITRYLFSKRERREYQQKIATANNEIIYAIRPAIAEKVIPSEIMLDALFSATARKYAVDASDLYSRASLSNELIKEVMDNTFLSSQQKVEFCELLSSLKSVEKGSDGIQKVEIIRVSRSDNTDTSTVLGMVTAMMALTITLYVYIKDKEGFLTDGVLSKYLPMLALLTIIPIIAVFIKDILRKVRRLEREVTLKEKPESASDKNNKEPNNAINSDS